MVAECIFGDRSLVDLLDNFLDRFWKGFFLNKVLSPQLIVGSFKGLTSRPSTADCLHGCRMHFWWQIGMRKCSGKPKKTSKWVDTVLHFMFLQHLCYDLFICTLISENQGLEKSRFYSNLRKISGPANLDFFFSLSTLFENDSITNINYPELLTAFYHYMI